MIGSFSHETLLMRCVCDCDALFECRVLFLWYREDLVMRMADVRLSGMECATKGVGLYVFRCEREKFGR